MDLSVVTYLLYLAVTVPLTVWVGRVLQRNGAHFLIDVFRGDEQLARAVNQLLVTGFYLLNLGYVALFMASAREVDSGRAVLEVLSGKVGGVAVVVGLIHFANVWMLNAFRRRAIQQVKGQPPVAPSYLLPPQVPGAPWAAPGAAG
jgi:hypothetical protein